MKFKTFFEYNKIIILNLLIFKAKKIIICVKII